MTTIETSHRPMDEKRFSGQRFFGAGLAVSLLLHALAAVMLIGGVELDEPEPGQQPIDVELVPPPEPQVPEPPPELQELEVPEPEIPEPEVSELEEQAPPPEPESLPEEQPEPEQEVAELPPSVPVLQPVVEFGETDSGSRVDLDGDSSEAPDDPEQPEGEAEATEDPVLEDTEPEADVTEDLEEEDTGAEDTELSETVQDEVVESPEEVEPDPVEVLKPELSQEIEEAEVELEPEPQPQPQTELADEIEDEPEDFGVVGPIATLTTPTPKPALNRAPARQENSSRSETMTQVRTLFSASILGDRRARTAMNGLTRSERVNLLCMTEMRAQLRAADPPRSPEYLPSFRLLTGTVLQPRQAAFRSAGRWYDLDFRCELNFGATRVVKFSYRVGAEVPRTQWRERGFPSF